MLAVGFIIGMFFTCAVTALLDHFRSTAPILPQSGEDASFHYTRLRAQGSTLSFQAHHNPSRGGNA